MGTAPTNMREVSMMLTPVNYEVHRVRAADKGASVAPANTCTEAVRAPANMAGAASEIRILRKHLSPAHTHPDGRLHGVRIDVAQTDIGIQ